jgi:hypothetical protein
MMQLRILPQWTFLSAILASTCSGIIVQRATDILGGHYDFIIVGGERMVYSTMI